MKLKVYNVINNPLPKLNVIKEFEMPDDYIWCDDNIVKMFNKHLLMDKLDSEHSYALCLTYGYKPRGILQISIGDNCSCPNNIRGLGIGLLLIGTEQFMCFHNHPGHVLHVSEDDEYTTQAYRDLGETIGVNFIKHVMITKGGFLEC